MPALRENGCMRQKTRVVYFTLTILVLMVVLFLGSDILIRLVVVPITRIIWWIVHITQIYGQEFYWKILIFVVLIFLIYLFPRENNLNTLSAYQTSSEKEDRLQFWKRIFTNAQENEADRLILISNLNRLQNDLELMSEISEIEPIKVKPTRNNFFEKIRSYLYKRPIFSCFLKIHLVRKRDSFGNIEDFLKSLENTMEIKNGKTNNQSSNR